MAIKVASLVAERVELRDSDPTGDTWIDVKAVTGRQDLERGRLLKISDIMWDESGRLAKRVIVNPAMLRMEELWLPYGGSHVVLAQTDADGAETKVELFLDGAKITRERFMEDASKLPPLALREWSAAVRVLNPDWQYPF